VPADDETVVMTVEPEPPAAALEDDAPAGELLPAAAVPLLPVLHAATSSATPQALPAPAASRARADIRFATKFRTALLSPLARPDSARLRFQVTVSTIT
jgi:hypothetical protein